MSEDIPDIFVDQVSGYQNGVKARIVITKQSRLHNVNAEPRFSSEGGDPQTIFDLSFGNPLLEGKNGPHKKFSYSLKVST